MRVDLRSALSKAIETFDHAREEAWIVAAIENTTEGDDAMQALLDALALVTARAMAMLPPVEADDWR